jgi:hypothetical protein
LYGNYGSQTPNMYSGYQTPRRRHRGRNAFIWLVVLVVVLVGADFGAKAFAENEAAVQIQKHGFPRRPTVAIAGFPFLTQVITRHFHQITISSGSFPEGPVPISRLSVVADNVHLNSSFKGGTAGPLNGTVLIGLGSIGKALSVVGSLAQFLGGGKTALKISSVGGDEVKGTLALVGGAFTESAVWKVETNGPHEIDLHLVDSSGITGSLLGAASNIAIPLPSLPAGLQLTGGLNSSASGITAHVYASSLSFGS